MLAGVANVESRYLVYCSRLKSIMLAKSCSGICHEVAFDEKG